METLEEVTAGGATTGANNNNKDLSQIVKGKRTKRQRPQSPIPFTIATTHSSSGDGSNVDYINVNNNIATPTNDSDDEYFLGTISEEDEDVAKCLILLSRGRVQPSSIKIHLDQEREDYGTYKNNNKFTSKRYLENPTSEPNGKVYAHECKTCGRTFPSFQALGGHRASHKKPKNMAMISEEEKMSSYNFLSSDEEEEPMFKNVMMGNNKRRRTLSQLWLELSSSSSRGIMCSNPKVHECSYCGAEFNSGQALGGHMRRHRGEAIISRNTNHNNLSFSALSLASMDQPESEELLAEAKKSNINLSLDLNLPAAPDDHHKFNSLDSKQKSQQQLEEEQQTALTLSTERLIQCQY